MPFTIETLNASPLFCLAKFSPAIQLFHTSKFFSKYLAPSLLISISTLPATLIDFWISVLRSDLSRSKKPDHDSVAGAGADV
jgi:hypothetical protein